MRALIRAAVAAAIAFVATAAAAQQQELPRASERIDVSIVEVDVVVANRSGKPVRGLTRDDFEIRDNGVLQPITNFTEYAAPVASAGVMGPEAEDAEVAAMAPHQPRTIVIFVERFNLPKKVSDRFFVHLKRLVRETVRPGDSAAVVQWTWGMRVRQDFTDDIPALERALDQVSAENSRHELDPNAFRLWAGFLQELLDEASMLQDQAPQSALTLEGREGARHEFLNIRRKANAITTLMSAMSAVPGKRILLFVSHRFSQFAGAEYFPGEMPLDARDEYNTRQIREEVAAYANSAGVSIYPIFPEGVEQVVFADPEERARRDVIMIRGVAQRRDADRWQQDLQKLGRSGNVLLNETVAIGELARRTGGVAAWGQTDVVRLVDAIRSDLSNYYSLAFRIPPGGAEGRPRRLAVKAKNSSYAVRTRSDYVEKNDAMRMRDRVRTAMYTPLRSEGMPFDVVLGEPRRAGRRYRIPVELRIPVGALESLIGGEMRSGTFNVYAAAGGLLGIMSDVIERSQAFEITDSDADKARAAVIKYEFELQSDARADRVTIGIQDETSREWSVVTVRIPAKKVPGA